jgi:hypothetical protein
MFVGLFQPEPHLSGLMLFLMQLMDEWNGSVVVGFQSHPTAQSPADMRRITGSQPRNNARLIP